MCTIIHLTILHSTLSSIPRISWDSKCPSNSLFCIRPTQCPTLILSLSQIGYLRTSVKLRMRKIMIWTLHSSNCRNLPPNNNLYLSSKIEPPQIKLAFLVRPLQTLQGQVSLNLCPLLRSPARGGSSSCSSLRQPLSLKKAQMSRPWSRSRIRRRSSWTCRSSPPTSRRRPACFLLEAPL